MFSVLKPLLDTSSIKGFFFVKYQRTKSDGFNYTLPPPHSLSIYYSKFSETLAVNFYDLSTELFVDCMFSEFKIMIKIEHKDGYVERLNLEYNSTEEELFQLSTVQNIYGIDMEKIELFNRIKYHYVGELCSNF